MYSSNLRFAIAFTGMFLDFDIYSTTLDDGVGLLPCFYLGDSQKNVQIHVTEFYLLEKALNSNWKCFHQTQHNVINQRDLTEGIEVLRVLRKICLNPSKCHKIACNCAAIATLNVIFIMRERVKLNKTYPTYLDYRLL